MAGAGQPINEDPQFTSGPMGDFYLGQTAAGQLTDSPCLNAGDDLAENTGFELLTTSSCHGPDTGLVDMGFHSDARRYSTLSAGLACTPAAGTLPFATTIDCTLTNNYAILSRRGKAVVSIHLAGGGFVSNWRSGVVSLGPEAVFHTSFPQTIPALADLVGTTTLELTIDDVTPPPFNQPPYPPSGDRDTDRCTVEGVAP